VLFERAFEEKTTRPTPTEWIEALVDLSENLEQCIFHPGHHFYNSLPSCPWCKLESKTGLILFPFTIKGENGDGEKPFNIYTVENLLANIGTSKKNLPATLPQPVYAQSLDPTPAIANKALKERNIQILIGSFYVVSIIISAFIFEFVVVCIFNFLLLSFCIYLVKLTGKPIRDELDRSLAKLQNELEMLQNKWAKFVLFDDSGKEVNEIRKKVENYKKLQQKSVRDLKRLHTDIRRRQFNENLRSSKLRDADIWGMTDEKLEFLNKKGIKTAAEVTEKRLLYYYNIDNETTEKLLEWRREIEGKFKYNSKPEIIHVEKEKIKQRTSEERNKIEEDINELLKFTGSGSTQLKEKQEELTTQSKQYREAISQVETNKETLGDPTKTITALVYISVIITFVFPFLGVVFSEGYFFTANDPQYIEKKVSDNYDPPILSDDTLTEIPDERITNKEIAEMPVSERNRIITALISRSLSRFGNYAAEKDLNFALRFDKKNIQVLGELGSVLYKEKEYSESLSILQYAVNLGDESDVTKKYIGMNYLQLKRYEDAYYIFLEMTEGTKGSYEAYFNLGLAYKGLDDYKSAKMAFQMALFHDGENAEAHYELGFVFYKLNEKEEFNKQYKKLLDIDKGKAEYLMASVNESPPPDQLLIK
jgi:Tfp pilus assembly protein PilF